jgi:hypothetical protein
MSSKIHHAIVIEGDGESGKAWICDYIEEKFELRIKTNPDVHFIEHERFSIKDAHSLKEQACQTPFGNVHVFVIVCETILREAQNALLKLFEEPASNTYFLILIPNKHSLLPTVTSRLSYGGRVAGTLKEEEFAQRFLSGNIGERLEMLSPIIKDKERVRARECLDAIEFILRAQGVKKHAVALKEVAFIRGYVSDTASSLKMLLEHLAVVI